MRRSAWLTVALWGGLLGLLSSCDSAPGPEALGLRPPTLSDFSYSPQRVVFGLLPPDQIEGDRVLVPLELSVVARGPEVPIEEVAYVVQAPTSLTDPIATGTMQPAGGDRYTASTTLSLSADEIATYTIVVYAVDQARRVSGEVRGLLHYLRVFEPGSPPVIEAIEAPDSLTRPAPGAPAVALKIIAVVSDPDGLNEVEKVEFWNVNTPNTRLLMCDDGGGRPCGIVNDSGDDVAGDGRFTLTVFLTSDNAPGVNTFAFQVTDRAGLTSEIVEKQIEVK
ncbi:MAG: hypothetical protein ACE5G0_11410 [Rhodothermales bacterium]